MIITIIVLIVLAAISFTTLNTNEKAVLAKYVQEFEELRKCVETKRLSNAKTGTENIDDGFSRVYVDGNIPYSFLSINSEGPKEAYLISLDYVGCDEMATGKDYKRFEAEGENIKTVKFGEDDVYVYDSKGKVFYARGFEFEDNTYYEQISSSTSIKIIKIDKSFIGEYEKVKVVITIESDNNIDSVILKSGSDSINATPIGGNKYEVEVDKNGIYEVIAKDVEGNTDKKDLVITGIGSQNGPTVVAEVINGTYDSNTNSYKITEETAKIKIYSDTAEKMHVAKTNETPTSWLPYANEIERTYTSNGEKILYIWVKDENGNICSEPYE